ncbi:MAG: Alsin [Candelina submexicana]|nr:MAG: Alsin [Candelina submexicana]
MDLAVSSNIEPPPLLFGARPSTPDPASQDQQPSHPQSLFNSQSSPLDTAPPPATEMDLSTSTTLPQPEGQNHERSDSEMENTDDVPNSHVVEPLVAESADIEDNARQQDPRPEAMDTSPDSQQEPSSNGVTVPEGDSEASVPAATSEVHEGDHEPQEAPVGGNAEDTAVPIVESLQREINGRNTEIGSTSTPPAPPANPEDSGAPPPPPAPLVDAEQPHADASATQREFSDSDTSTDDEEEPHQIRWEEDLSTPDEEELKEIEEKGPEISALDYNHWQTKFFTDLDDPEYVPGEFVRIDWTVPNVHGSLENPNKETVMRSPRVRLGGLDWNIKYYPRGNDTEQLSIYIECAKPQPEKETTTDAAEAEKKQEPKPLSHDVAPITVEQDAAPPAQSATEQGAEQMTSSPSAVDSEEGDVAIESTKGEPDDTWGAAAQFGVVIYNPNEPRVKYSRGNRHRFCAKSPDWGWTRFHGPHAQIHKRFRGERQALLRNDTLSFSAYVRIIKDDTGALWESGHISDWDSLAKTGFRAIGSTRPHSNPVVTAIQAWLLFVPFRELVCTTTVPDPIKESRATPKPLIAALQKIAYSIQDRRKPTNSPVSLEGLSRAFAWYGFHFNLGDVVAFWELLRRLMEEELRGTNTEGKLGILFDGLLDKPATHDSEDVSSNSKTRIGSLSAGMAPSFRVPVKGVQNMQAAVAQTLNNGDPTSRPTIVQPPIFLQLELDRQMFDINTRRWIKLVDRIDLDEEIDLGAWIMNADNQSKYVLYGFIVHSGDLHSGYYYSVVRPGGPGTRWLRCKDRRSHSTVKCLTKKQALDRHCGIASGRKSDGTEPVAYVVMYVRKDVAQDVLKGIPEPWEAPQWIKEDTDPNSPKEASQDVSYKTENQKEDDKLELLVYDSRLFEGRTGEGLIDFDDPSLDPNRIYQLTVPSQGKLSTVIEELDAQVPSLKADDSKAWVWVIDCDNQATLRHPCLIEDNDWWTFQKLRQDYPACRLWVHLLTSGKDPESHLLTLADLIKADVVFTAESKVPPPPKAADNPPPAEDPSTSSFSSDTDSTAPAQRVEDGAETELTDDRTAGQPAGENARAEGGTSAAADPSEDTPMAEASDYIPTSGADQVDNDSRAFQPSSIEVSDSDTQIPLATNQQTASASDADMEDPAVEVAPTSQDESTEIVSSPSVPQPSASLDQSAAEANRSLQQDDIEMQDPHREEAQLAPESAIEGESQPAAAADLTPSLPHIGDVIYFFLKWFDAKEQTLKAVGSFFALRDEDMTVCVRRLLNLPKDKAITLWCENQAAEVKSLDLPRQVSRDLDMPGSIIIVQDSLSDAETLAIEEEAGYPDPKSYIRELVNRRSNPFVRNGHQTYSYFSESYHSGETRNGRFHGHGTSTTLNGQTYTGNFMSSYMHGTGCMTYQNKDVYTGEFHKNEMHGQGKMVYAKTGNVYEGGWRNGRRHGKGVMRYEVSEEEERLCQICYEIEMDALFYDCGHVCACLECAGQVENCPVCRKGVVAVVKIYRT